MGNPIKPQRVWKWEIAIYLYLAGMGAGSFVVGMGTLWAFRPVASVTVLGFHLDIARLALLWGPILVAVGARFLILDLGIQKHFLYACLNPLSSWVARGSSFSPPSSSSGVSSCGFRSLSRPSSPYPDSLVNP